MPELSPMDKSDYLMSMATDHFALALVALAEHEAEAAKYHMAEHRKLHAAHTQLLTAK